MAESLGTGLAGPRARRSEETTFFTSLQAGQGNRTFLHPLRGETAHNRGTVQTFREHAEKSLETHRRRGPEKGPFDQDPRGLSHVLARNPASPGEQFGFLGPMPPATARLETKVNATDRG